MICTQVWGDDGNTFTLRDVPTRVTRPGDPDERPQAKKARGLFGRKRSKKHARALRASDDLDDDDAPADSDDEDRKEAPEDVEDSDDEQTREMPGERDAESTSALAEAARARREDAARLGEPSVDVRAELFDDDPVGRDFLGMCQISWGQLMTPGEHVLGLEDRPLKPNAKRPRREKPERYRTQGTLTVEIQHEAIVEVTILEAVGLAQHDVFDISDPYCVVKWGSQKLGKTPVRDNTLDPRWYQPAIEFSVPMKPIETDFTPDELHIEVWESDTFSRDDFMGLVSIPRDAVVYPSPGVPRFLRRRPAFSEDPYPQGYVEALIRSSYVPKAMEPRKAEKIPYIPIHEAGGEDAPEAEVVLHVLRGGGLLQQDLIGGADPFVIVRKDGKMIGRTKVRNDTLRPVWRNETFWFAVPLKSDGTPAERIEVRLEVWDADFASKTLMGVVRLGADQLVTTSDVTRYSLLPECPSKRFLDDPKGTDPGLGWLEVRSVVAGRLTLDVHQADEIRAADASGASPRGIRPPVRAVPTKLQNARARSHQSRFG